MCRAWFWLYLREQPILPIQLRFSVLSLPLTVSSWAHVSKTSDLVHLYSSLFIWYSNLPSRTARLRLRLPIDLHPLELGCKSVAMEGLDARANFILEQEFVVKLTVRASSNPILTALPTLKRRTDQYHHSPANSSEESTGNGMLGYLIFQEPTITSLTDRSEDWI